MKSPDCRVVCIWESLQYHKKMQHSHLGSVEYVSLWYAHKLWERDLQRVPLSPASEYDEEEGEGEGEGGVTVEDQPLHLHEDQV